MLKVSMKIAVLNALGTLLSARFNNATNQIGPGVRSYNITGKDYHRMAPTPANTYWTASRQVIRRAARAEAKALAAKARLVHRKRGVG